MTSLTSIIVIIFLVSKIVAFISHPCLNVVTHDMILHQYIKDQSSISKPSNETTNDYEIPGWVNKSAFKYNLPNRFKAKQYDKHIDRMLTKRSKSK